MTNALNTEDQLIILNEKIEEKCVYLLHLIEKQLDSLYIVRVEQEQEQIDCTQEGANFSTNSVSPTQRVRNLSNSATCNSLLTFKAPYIKDIRGFSSPLNQDAQQMKDLKGVDNIDLVLKQRSWSRESKTNLEKAIQDEYAKNAIIKLIKDKNSLHNEIKQSFSSDEKTNLSHKIRLVDEQIEQIQSRKDPRMYIPDKRQDSTLDLLSISAQQTNTAHDAHDCRLMWSNYLHYKINKSNWTREEDSNLLNAVEKYGRNDWDMVANELNNQRVPWQCCARYQQILVGRKIKVSAEGIDKIIEVTNLCRIGDFVLWNRVMYIIQPYTLSQVKYIWYKYICEQKFAKRPWSKEEDSELLLLVKKHGHKDWVKISNFMTNRSSRSCRERYTMRLKFFKRSIGGWNRKESLKLLNLSKKCEMQWSKIASHFPDRNPHQVRSKFCLLQQKQLNESTRTNKLKRRFIYNSESGVVLTKTRPKPKSEIEVDNRLNEILSLYCAKQSKSLICRGSQDETIYQALLRVINDVFVGSVDSVRLSESMVFKVLIDALSERVFHTMFNQNSSKLILAPPNSATLRGYKYWTLFQDHLDKIMHREFSDKDLQTANIDDIISKDEYANLFDKTLSLYLWPAVLAKKLHPPPPTDIKAINESLNISIVNKSTLYSIREIQRKLFNADAV